MTLHLIKTKVFCENRITSSINSFDLDEDLIDSKTV